MTTDEGLEPTIQVAPKSEITKSLDFCTIYSNWVQTNFSPHEVSLLLGQSFQSSPETVEVELKARIIFGPLEAIPATSAAIPKRI
jgi:hypothetical protein